MPRGPFSEPREWTRCPCCNSGDWNRAASGHDPTMPCPECGQPPRCKVGSTRLNPRPPGRCPRPATTSAFTEGADLCGQHARSFDLSGVEDDWKEAGEHLGHFRALAEALCNPALLEAMDLAWAECQMRQESAERERRMIWEEGR